MTVIKDCANFDGRREMRWCFQKEKKLRGMKA